VLDGLGDKRFIKSVEIGPVPQLVLEHNGWFGKTKPPRTAMWAWLSAPRMGTRYVAAKHASPSAVVQNTLAEWEAQLVWGALRDAFCANGGPPLVGWSTAGHPNGVSDATYPFGQRFPAPSRAAFAARAKLVGQRYGFRVVSIRWLRPLQPAPIVVVQTDRKRTSFVADVQAIEQLLDPRQTAYHRTAVTFEGFFFEARDAKGPFAATFGNVRGTLSGGPWAWNPCHYPYATLGVGINQRC
jgi:hypothetical protein